jgi:hypothetical protein
MGPATELINSLSGMFIAASGHNPESLPSISHIPLLASSVYPVLRVVTDGELLLLYKQNRTFLLVNVHHYTAPHTHFSMSTTECFELAA